MEDHEHDPCASHDATHAPERPHYFHGKLLTEDDLNQEQEYLRSKQRMHNRLLHGWGVVAGLEVTAEEGTTTVAVAPGYALDPCGNEILVPESVVVDVAESLPPGATDDRTVYLAVRYGEVPSEPTHSPDDEEHFSRIQETFDFALLSGLPDAYDPMPSPDFADFVKCSDAVGNRPFPPPETDPWLILADLVVKPDDTVVEIDDRAHRRFVAAMGEFALSC